MCSLPASAAELQHVWASSPSPYMLKGLSCAPACALPLASDCAWWPWCRPGSAASADVVCRVRGAGGAVSGILANHNALQAVPLSALHLSAALCRVLGGLWPLTDGVVRKPGGSEGGLAADIFYVPQRPYVTVGSLRDQITYPLRQTGVPALRDLGHLCARRPCGHGSAVSHCACPRRAEPSDRTCLRKSMSSPAALHLPVRPSHSAPDCTRQLAAWCLAAAAPVAHGTEGLPDTGRGAGGGEALTEGALRALLHRVDLQHLVDRAGGFSQVLLRCRSGSRVQGSELVVRGGLLLLSAPPADLQVDRQGPMACSGCCSMLRCCPVWQRLCHLTSRLGIQSGATAPPAQHPADH